MNGFVIAAGEYVEPLHHRALVTAANIGVVTIDVGNTDCKVPVASESIARTVATGKLGQKRKTIRC